jgi:hypothetical protein
VDQKETLSNIDLVNASGELVQVSVDYDWRISINDRLYPAFSSVEGLCIVALHSVAGAFVPDDRLEKIIFGVHEEGVGNGASQNSLVKNGIDLKDRVKNAFGRLAVRTSPLFDNITLIDVNSKRLSLLVRNFDDLSPEHDKRQSMIDTAVGLTHYQQWLLNNSMDRDFRSKAKRAEENRRIKEINSRLVTVRMPEQTTNTVVQVTNPKDLVKDPRPKRVKIKPGKKVRETEPKVKEPSVPNQARVDFTDPKTYANGLYWSIDGIPRESYTNKTLIGASDALSGIEPDPAVIDKIIRLAIDNRILKLEKYLNRRTDSVETVYKRI